MSNRESKTSYEPTILQGEILSIAFKIARDGLCEENIVSFSSHILSGLYLCKNSRDYYTTIVSELLQKEVAGECRRKVLGVLSQTLHKIIEMRFSET